MTKLIAEIGWNFLGDMSIAKEMISAAKESGADFAKFQTWSTKDLVDGPWHKDNRINLYKKAELSEDDHYELKEFCQKKKIIFLTSVFNKKYWGNIHFIQFFYHIYCIVCLISSNKSSVYK